MQERMDSKEHFLLNQNHVNQPSINMIMMRNRDWFFTTV